MIAEAVAAPVIRQATGVDVPSIVAMAEHFLASTVYRTRTATTPESLRTAALLMIENGVVLLAVSDEGVPQGMLAGLTYDHYLTNVRMASESVWWVEPAARGGQIARDLLRAFEAWAEAKGATEIEIGSWHPRLDRFYERLGYAAAERVFRKVVRNGA